MKPSSDTSTGMGVPDWLKWLLSFVAGLIAAYAAFTTSMNQVSQRVALIEGKMDSFDLSELVDLKKRLELVEREQRTESRYNEMLVEGMREKASKAMEELVESLRTVLSEQNQSVPR